MSDNPQSQRASSPEQSLRDQRPLQEQCPRELCGLDLDCVLGAHVLKGHYQQEMGPSRRKFIRTLFPPFSPSASWLP